MSALVMEGVVARPGEPGYDDACNIWNAACCGRRPSIVARCTSAADVAAAIAFARANGLEVSVRGGGHNYAGHALTDGGLMIDLTPMKTVTVRAGDRRASCGGGTTWGEMDAATQVHGLAVPGGFISHTGVAGLTLGGGIGWLTRFGGLSSDNLIGAEVVTASGRIVQAADDADLLWALRGGGGNFGVVTRFDFQSHPVGPNVHLGLFLFEPAQGRELFRFAREFVSTMPDASSVFLAGLSAPPAPFVPEHLHFAPAFALIVVGLGDAASHAQLIAPIKRALKPMVELVTPMPFVALQRMFDDAAPWGFHAYEKAVYLRKLTDGAIDVILEHQARKMSPLSFVPIFVLGGAYARADGSASAFGGDRDVRYVVNISAMTPQPDRFEAERAWARDYWSALVPHAVGVGSYVNFMSEIDGDRIRAAYGDKYERLRALKRRYDPDNTFHLNPNIPPA
ncbi:MAG: FAD-binding oxidoreductase [Polyangiaceae bacterium]|nr:FAD-binding oxidoreductase [Polyangiaceae bacterium]